MLPVPGTIGEQDDKQRDIGRYSNCWNHGMSIHGHSNYRCHSQNCQEIA